MFSTRDAAWNGTPSIGIGAMELIASPSVSPVATTSRIASLMGGRGGAWKRRSMMDAASDAGVDIVSWAAWAAVHEEKRNHRRNARKV